MVVAIMCGTGFIEIKINLRHLVRGAGPPTVALYFYTCIIRYGNFVLLFYEMDWTWLRWN